jgi:hypothetical protein
VTQAGDDTAANLFSLPTEGLAPWIAAEHSYAGWVPTVLGHLAFSMVGVHRCTPKFHCFNRNDLTRSRRVVVVHQRRTAQDYLISGETLRHFRPQVSHDCFIVAETAGAKTPFPLADGSSYETFDNQGALTGVILVVPEEKAKPIKANRKTYLKGLIDLIEDENTLAAGLTETVLTRTSDARLSGVAVLQLRFALFRTGEFRLWFGMKDLLGREVHQGAVPPSADEIELAEALPPQVFFLVKDAAHKHYHHEPDSDQLLPLTKMEKAQTAEIHKKNEIGWRRETLWGLARVISQYRRNDALYDYKKAMGVLAYADAFQSTLARVVRPMAMEEKVVDHRDLTVYDFAHTKASVEAMEGLASWRKSGWIQLFAAMFGGILSSLALWAGAVQIYPVMCEPLEKSKTPCDPAVSTGSIEIVHKVAEHPLVFTGSIVILGMTIFMLILRDLSFVPFGSKIKRLLSPLAKAAGASLARRAGDRIGFLLALLILASLSGLFAYFAYIFARHMLTN